jgi:16S rRNA processing protein RimM
MAPRNGRMMGRRGNASSTLLAGSATRAAPHPAPARNHVCVARIGAAVGTRGEVRLWSFTSDPQAIARYGVLESADGARRFEIEGMRPGKGFFVARLKGIADRSAAERLCNIDLYVPRERLPEPDKDEFYHADLVGLDAHDPRGNRIGAVAAVHNFGAGDLLEIAPSNGGETVLVPFTVATVPKVEIETGRIVIDLPPGLLDPAISAPADAHAASKAQRGR